MSDRDDPTTGPFDESASDEAAFDEAAFDDPAFDDPAFDELRALLADARSTEPVPADVAARLDDTLAALQEERRAETVVVPLRGRRAVGRFLVAAAAVVVIGAGGVGVANLAQNGSNNAASSADKAASGAAGEAATNGPVAPQDLAGSTSPAPTPRSQLSDLKATSLPQFTTSRFAQQAAAFDPASGDFSTNTTDSDKAYQSARSPSVSDAPTAVSGQAAACTGPSLPDTTSFPILLDGHDAVLVVHKVVDGTQEVDAWSCDGKTELTTTSVTR